jgi:hypothetical protein
MTARPSRSRWTAQNSVQTVIGLNLQPRSGAFVSGVRRSFFDQTDPGPAPEILRGSRMERNDCSVHRFDIISSKPTVGMGVPRASQPLSGG